ncbi:MAG: hypothetical protein V4507_00320 [Verrucomicrobiota bacterium]
MKIDISKVAQALKEINVSPADSRKVIEKLQLESEKDKKEPSSGPKSKKQFVIVASDTKGILKSENLVGWVLQIEESASPATIKDRINKAAFSYNNSRKGRLTPVSTVGETLENVPRRFFKSDDDDSTNTLVKTKEPVLIIASDNKLAS